MLKMIYEIEIECDAPKYKIFEEYGIQFAYPKPTLYYTVTKDSRTVFEICLEFELLYTIQNGFEIQTLHSEVTERISIHLSVLVSYLPSVLLDQICLESFQLLLQN